MNSEGEQNNPIVNAYNAIRSDIDTERIKQVVNIEDGRPKIDPRKAKKLAYEDHKWKLEGLIGGGIVGAVISISGGLILPAAAVGYTLGYAIENNAIDQVEVLEEDFKTVVEAIEQEEEVDLSRLAMITHIKKETLEEEYLPYLEEQGFVEFDEDNDVIIYSEPVLQQAASYIRR